MSYSLHYFFIIIILFLFIKYMVRMNIYGGFLTGFKQIKGYLKHFSALALNEVNIDKCSPREQRLLYFFQ